MWGAGEGHDAGEQIPGTAVGFPEWQKRPNGMQCKDEPRLRTRLETNSVFLFFLSYFYISISDFFFFFLAFISLSTTV